MIHVFRVNNTTKPFAHVAETPSDVILLMPLDIIAYASRVSKETHIYLMVAKVDFNSFLFSVYTNSKIRLLYITNGFLTCCLTYSIFSSLDYIFQVSSNNLLTSMNVTIQVSITALKLGTVLISKGIIPVLVPPGLKEMGGEVDLVAKINYQSLRR